MGGVDGKGGELCNGGPESGGGWFEELEFKCFGRFGEEGEEAEKGAGRMQKKLAMLGEGVT